PGPLPLGGIKKQIMPDPKKVKAIVIHCSAGFGDVEANKRYWKSLGWRSVGYHFMIDVEGNIHELAPLEAVANGVKDHNARTVHICYIGGVEKLPNGKFKAKDTRTSAQKSA